MLDVKALLTKILEKLSGPLLVEEKLIVDNLTIASGSFGDPNKNITKAGYKAIGIVGVRTENASSGGTLNTYCMLQRFYISQNTTAYFVIRNFSSSAAKVKVTATILYEKL